MRRSFSRSMCAGVCAVALVAFAALPASAGDDVRRRGSCSGGPGHWDLRVERVDMDTLRVRFKIEDVDPGETWQLFLSDNGDRVFSGTKDANSEGEVRVRRQIADRAGTDRIRASGVNEDQGTTCLGSVRF